MLTITSTDLLVPRRQLAETAAKLSEWTFENFRPSQLMSIPHAAKEQMFHDFRHVARSRRNGADACKASFQVALSVTFPLISFSIVLNKHFNLAHTVSILPRPCSRTPY